MNPTMDRRGPGTQPVPGMDPELWAAWARAGFPSMPPHPHGWPQVPASPPPSPQAASHPHFPYPFPPPYPPMAPAPFGYCPSCFAGAPPPANPKGKGGLAGLFGGDEHSIFHTLAPWLDFSDKDFLKGALLGAAAAYLLTNEKAQGALMKGAARSAGKMKVKLGKVRKAFSEAAAEAAAEAASETDES